MHYKVKRNGNIQQVVAISLLAILVTVVASAALLAPHGIAEIIGVPWDDSNSEYLLGLDNLGRDMFSRILFGGQITLTLGLWSTVLAFVVGVYIALASVVLGRWVDVMLTRIADAFMSLPPLIFSLLILSMLGTGRIVLVATIASLSAVRFFRVARSLAGNIVILEYVEASQLRKESLHWIMLREVFPNIIRPLATHFGLQLCNAILLVASLGFLGFGLPPPSSDWGSMVRENASALGFGILAPLIPAAAIGLFVISINLLIDSLANQREGGTRA